MFQTFLGQKYGYRPYPAKIEQIEFEQLLSAVEKRTEKETLERWFKLDTNATPHEYILQPVTSLLPNYRNKENEKLRREASSEWWSNFETMQIALRKAAIKTLNDNQRMKYIISGEKKYVKTFEELKHK